jgi:hypothetical protein
LRALSTEAALAAVLLVSGCAAGTSATRAELDALRAEVVALRGDGRELARAVDGLSSRVDVLAARLGRASAEARAEPRAAEPRAEAPVVPGGLAVVKVEPPPARRVPAAAPAVATAVPLVEPEPARLEALSRRSGRGLATEAEAELRAARRREGIERAHALEDFAGRYPRHPRADDALADAAVAYAGAGREDAACALARRIAEEYPAGDAASDALWRMAACEARDGAPEAESRVLTRLVTEFPSTPAARRAGERLAAITGGGGAGAPDRPPARSAP